MQKTDKIVHVHTAVKIFIVCLIAGYTAHKFLYSKKSNGAAPVLPKEQIDYSRLTNKVSYYTTGPLAGRRIADLYAHYMGVTGTIPDTVAVDYSKQLKLLWQLKDERYPGYPVAKETGRILIEEYRLHKIQHVTLEDFITQADASAKQTFTDLDWQRVMQLTRLNQEKGLLLQHIAGSIGGIELIAYALTELMPSADGKLNVALLDFLLRNAGYEFVMRIPAIHDPKTSFGPYQFTEYALYDVREGKHKDIRGASVINMALPEELRIPGSVSLLRAEQHHRAAYLFVVDNLARMIRSLNSRQVQTLRRLHSSQKTSIVQYIATAHHAPYLVPKRAKYWLDNNGKTEYYRSCAGRLLTYAKKTRANYAALQNRHNILSN